MHGHMNVKSEKNVCCICFFGDFVSLTFKAQKGLFFKNSKGLNLNFVCGIVSVHCPS
jgi:hypothetical protein